MLSPSATPDWTYRFNGLNRSLTKDARQMIFSHISFIGLTSLNVLSSPLPPPPQKKEKKFWIEDVKPWTVINSNAINLFSLVVFPCCFVLFCFFLRYLPGRWKPLVIQIGVTDASHRPFRPPFGLLLSVDAHAEQSDVHQRNGATSGDHWRIVRVVNHQLFGRQLNRDGPFDSQSTDGRRIGSRWRDWIEWTDFARSAKCPRRLRIRPTTQQRH